jgi:N-acetylglucosamine kinase-like BadF-type ATPase
MFARELIRSSNFKFTNDAEIALSGATAGEPGIIVIAGTGSIAFGRNELGKTARAGGWGYIYGDEGGAFDLTRRALRAALQYEEGWGPETSLRKRLLDVTAATSANELLHRFYTPEYPRSAVASLAPLVSGAAEEHDSVARDVIRRAAADLVAIVAGVYRQLFMGDQLVAVAHIGGVFTSHLLLGEFERQAKAALRCRVQPPRYNPAGGAVLEALRLDGNKNLLSGVPESVK